MASGNLYVADVSIVDGSFGLKMLPDYYWPGALKIADFNAGKWLWRKGGCGAECVIHACGRILFDRFDRYPGGAPATRLEGVFDVRRAEGMMAAGLNYRLAN